MICSKCQREIPDDAVLCCYCGKKYIKESRTGSRANGTGSVYRDSRSKRWVAQVVIGKTYNADMKVRFQYERKYFEKRTDALAAITTMGKEERKPSFTISYYYQTFKNGKFTELSSGKQYAYEAAYKRLKPLHSTEMKNITVNDLQAIFRGIRDYYPARDVRSLLNMLFRLAAADDRTINPALPSLVTMQKNEEAQVEPFTEEEQLQLWLSYESGNMDAAVPLIMIYTGLMTGEMRQLSKSMIDLGTKEIVGVGLKTKERKKRSVLLPDDIIPVLEDVMAKAETDRLYDLTKEQFYKLYYKVIKQAGITRHLTPYSCRHTTATVLAVHENVAPQTLQRVMRWKSTRMMDRYVTPTDSDARKAVNKI